MVKLTIGTIINTAMVKVHWVLLPNLSLNSLKQLLPSCANDFLMSIYEQVLRIDFWRDIRTNKYYLNEVEGKIFFFKFLIVILN